MVDSFEQREFTVCDCVLRTSIVFVHLSVHSRTEVGIFIKINARINLSARLRIFMDGDGGLASEQLDFAGFAVFTNGMNN